MRALFAIGAAVMSLSWGCQTDCPCAGLPICVDAGATTGDDVIEDVTEPPLDVYTPPDLGRRDVGQLPDTDSPFPVVAAYGWPLPNVYSWNGSWRATQDEFPLDGMYDNEYFDGHVLPRGGWDGATPILPPGEWDWDDSNDDFANYRNFSSNIGSFDQLIDAVGNHYGWRLVANTPEGVDYQIAGGFFEGTPGVDVLHLGAAGAIHGFTIGNLGHGPDVLVFDEAWSLDFFMGASSLGTAHDDDLVVAGCTPNADDTRDIRGALIHTGPGSDWVFARDLGGAGFDLGNLDGDTSLLDPADGDDLAVLRGNQTDFRIFGGAGDDVVVWYMDESHLGSIAFAGPNVFGGGGSGDALWDTEGTDRLVLVIPPDTEIVPFGDNPEGTLMVGVYYGDDGTIWWDEPMYGNPLTQYCITCGRGPNQERTITLAYHSASGHFETGWFWMTDIEELQLGLGDDAIVYHVNQQEGTLSVADELEPFYPPDDPIEYCDSW